MEKVSVLMVTHNRADLISESIRSVLNQSHREFELLVLDDGSTDNTEEVVSSFNDKRIRYVKTSRVGVLSELRNLAVSKSEHELIAFLDSDDLWLETRLEDTVKLVRESGAAICLADCSEFMSSGIQPSRGARLNKKTQVDLRQELLFNNVPLTYGSNLFFRRALWNELKFDERMQLGDHDFVLRAIFSAPSAYLPRVLVLVRKHNTNMSVRPDNGVKALDEFSSTLQHLYKQGHLKQGDYKYLLSENYLRLALASAAVRQTGDSIRHLRKSIGLRFSISHIYRFLKAIIKR